MVVCLEQIEGLGATPETPSGSMPCNRTVSSVFVCGEGGVAMLAHGADCVCVFVADP